MAGLAPQRAKADAAAIEEAAFFQAALFHHAAPALHEGVR